MDEFGDRIVKAAWRGRITSPYFSGQVKNSDNRQTRRFHAEPLLRPLILAGGYTRSQMKLRFRKNSLRLRINRLEVEMLAAGQELAERVAFAGGATLHYILTPSAGAQRAVEFDGKTIRVTAPLADWARGPEIGFYFEVEPCLKVAVEKDLQCVDGPEEEKDPHAYPRTEACLGRTSD